MHRINKTKTIKSLLLVFCLITMLLLFTGCANITYYVIPYNGDHYEQGLKVSLSKQEAVKYGYDLVELKNQVYALASNEANQWRTRFNTQLYNCYENEHITVDEYMFLNEVKPFQITTDQKQTEDGYDIYFIIKIYPASNNQYAFTLTQIVNIYKYADIKKPDDAEDDDTSFVEDIGIANLHGYTQESPYDNETIDSVAQVFLETLDYQAYGLSKKDVSYSYKYATTSKRQHSNADDVENINGYYIHTWVIPQDENGNVNDVTMKFFYTILNTQVWYWIGLGVAAVGGIIVTLILFIRHKQTKNKNKITIDN